MEDTQAAISDKNIKNENRGKDLQSTGNAQPQPGVIWKVSSGLFNIGSGAIGLGIGSVKWAASTTYNVGTGVVSATYNVGTGVVSATQNVASKVKLLPKTKSKKE